MDKKQYKKLMLETNKRVSKIVLEYLEPLRKENLELYRICSELLEKKIGTFETREYLMRVSFEICSRKKWTKEIMHACAAVELELASMYYTNRIFDDKGGEKILSQPNNQFIASMITKDLASQALTKACSKVNYKTFVRIKNIFDEINKIFYIGQYFEISANLYPKVNLAWKEMIDLYYKRNYGVNNSFFEKIALIGAILGNGTKEQINALGEFGKNYGMVMQIINDIGDFVPPKYNAGTEEKLPEDAYSDIKHKKLTLPLIYTLIKGSESNKTEIKRILERDNPSEEELIKVTELLVNNGSISFSQKIARDFMEKAKKAINIFSKEERDPLSTMGVISWSNRYYKALKEFKKS